MVWATDLEISHLPAPVSASRPSYGHGRKALITAAIRVVADLGIRKLTYRAVAMEAGVSASLVQHHFGTTAALLEEALDYCLAESLIPLTTARIAAQPDSVVAEIISTIKERPELQAFQYELILESRHVPELRSHVRRLYSEYRRHVRGALADMGFTEVDALARVVFAAIDGLSFQLVALGDTDGEDFDTAGAELQVLLSAALEGIKGRSPTR